MTQVALHGGISRILGPGMLPFCNSAILKAFTSRPTSETEETELIPARYSLGPKGSYVLPFIVLWPELSLQPHPDYGGTHGYL